MTKEEFLDVMKNLDWDNGYLGEIYAEISDAVHYYDDSLSDYYLLDFYDEESAREYTQNKLNDYGLYYVKTLLSELTLAGESVYIYQDGVLKDATKEELKQVCDEMVKWVEDYGK